MTAKYNIIKDFSVWVYGFNTYETIWGQLQGGQLNMLIKCQVALGTVWAIMIIDTFLWSPPPPQDTYIW